MTGGPVSDSLRGRRAGFLDRDINLALRVPQHSFHGFYAGLRRSMLENRLVERNDCFGNQPSAANP
jgi:hypothetical protein